MAKTTIAPDGTVTVETDASYEKASATWDGETTSQTVVKSDSVKRFTLSVGYPAELADANVARDGHRDFANRDEVEKAAWNYMRNSGGVGLYHADGTEGAGEVVESYLSPADFTADNGQVVKKGDWLVGIIWNPAAWAEIEAGRINGTSMQGRAARRTPSPADMARVLSKRG